MSDEKTPVPPITSDDLLCVWGEQAEVWDDKKGKWQSWVANISFDLNLQTSGSAYASIQIIGWGATREEAIEQLKKNAKELETEFRRRFSTNDPTKR